MLCSIVQLIDNWKWIGEMEWYLENCWRTMSRRYEQEMEMLLQDRFPDLVTVPERIGFGSCMISSITEIVQLCPWLDLHDWLKQDVESIDLMWWKKRKSTHPNEAEQSSINGEISMRKSANENKMKLIKYKNTQSIPIRSLMWGKV